MVWNPLLSPAPLVTAALAVGAKKPVLMIGGEVTLMLKPLLAVAAGLAESVARTVKLKVPLAVGVPVMAPLAA